MSLTLLCRRCGNPFGTDRIRMLCPPCALAQTQDEDTSRETPKDPGK